MSLWEWLVEAPPWILIFGAFALFGYTVNKNDHREKLERELENYKGYYEEHRAKGYKLQAEIRERDETIKELEALIASIETEIGKRDETIKELRDWLKEYKEN